MVSCIFIVCLEVAQIFPLLESVDVSGYLRAVQMLGLGTMKLSSTIPVWECADLEL